MEEIEQNAITPSLTSLRLNYDVFLSFRGEDTRKNITNNLYNALYSQGIRVFRDNEGLSQGDEIAPGLMEAINDSAAAIAIISPRYASSRWCLEELATICELGKLVLPVFFRVDPSDVRRQKGPFMVDFENLEARFGVEKAVRWRNAMERVGGISGWVYNNSDESQLIQSLVKRVLHELSNSPMIVAPFVVGIDYSLEELIRLLDVKRNGVKILGLHGIAGVGKTTLSKALYNKLACHFTHRTFILNAKEIATQQGIVSLQKKIIQGLFPSKPFSFSPNNAHDGRVKFRRMLQETRILLVLDDVDYVSDDVNILEALIGGKNWFFEGSRVVISTRNREVLPEDIVNETFEMRELGDTDSLKLFSYHAFKRPELSPPFHNISRQIVSITGGLPLALEVFGSFLFDKRSEEEWLDALEKLKQIRLPRLQDILKISYDGLDDEEKCIFLDVACLFLGQLDKKVEDVIDVMKGCGFRARIAFDTLTARSLIKVIDGGDLWMHDQIRDMGRQIVMEEGLFNHGNRSRLWDAAEVLSVLQEGKGTQHIQGIILNQQHKSSKIKSTKAITREQFQQAPSLSSALAYIKELYKQQFQHDAKETNELVLKTEVFDPIVNLRLLQIDNVKLEGNLGKLPSSLKWLQWKRCNLSSYYSNDYPSELAILDLSESQIERIGSREWTRSRKKAANKLKVMNLSDCHKITAIPDLSMHRALEKLIAERCSALQRIHRAIGNLKTLCHLNLRDCRNLVEFPSEVSGLKNLEKLILSGCSRLKQLPEDIGKMKSLQELLLDGTAIEKLPQSIFRLTKLERLSLNNCHSFKRLPRLLGNLSALKELSLNGSAVEEVPDSIGHLQNLHTLSLIWCGSLAAIPNSLGKVKSLANLWLYGSVIEIMPDSIGSLYYLRSLSLGKCQYLTALPVSIKGLSSLVELQIDNVPFRSLPDHVGALHSLKTLEIRNCARLGSLPHSIGELLALRTMTITRNDAITELPESVGKLQNLVILRLTKCKRLCKLPSSVGELKNLVHLLMEETAVTVLPESFGMLSSLMILRMGKKPFCQVLQSTEITGSATYAETGTAPIVLPASFSELSLLKELDAHAWRIVGKIPDDFEKLSYLEIINLGHNEFSHLPSSLKGLHFLKKLLIPYCKQLKALPPLPSSLLEIDAANCGSLESIHEISELKFLRELNLANCMSLVDIQGVECLKSLKMLHMAGCNVSCASIVGSKLDKVAVKNLDNFSIPGTEIPSWFTPSEVHFSRHENNEIKAVIIAIVVSVDCAEPDNLRDELPVIPNIFAKIVRANRPVYTTGMYLKGVPTTPEDQVYLCRYQDYHPLASILEDGDIIQVGLGNLPITGIELKKCGIHLVYECDDDYEGNEESLDESQQSVSERLTRFYGASDRESNIFSSDSAQEDGEGERTQSFFSFVKEIFCALKYLLFRRFSTHERGFFI
ncbi:disease resistance protein RUN1-like [Lycium barbarum]|uniref:disease resistance protein RUN1-like n=1 Tax=Lycium barbarum TaxID=112863 RepID=UPI00293F458C|nr:disease resistance protein RUN1-like [Lycium barbarum]